MFFQYYAVAFPVMLILDFIWLKFVARSFYFSRISHLMAEQVSLVPAFFFYALYAGGVVYFCIYPAVEAASLKKALVQGALFGFFCYMTYDLTNQATLKDWPVAVTIIDTIWGATVTAVTSVISTFILLKLRG